MEKRQMPSGDVIRRWRIRGASVAAGAVLLGGAAVGATAASADGQSPSPSPSASSSASTAGPDSSGSHAKHPLARALSAVLRVSIRAEAGFGDKAHQVAYLLIYHPKAFSNLPANLQTDLKTLEAAPASERDADASRIKDTALNGGYGEQIQKQAKNIQTKLAQTPAKPQ
ncbi:hypothetical protein ACTAQJ_05580 [Arthrobacter sp. alpha11c]